MSKSISFIDLQTTKTFLFDGKTFVHSNIKNKKIPISARVLYSDITTHSFQIKSDILESELLAEIELRMYEEAGLDPEKEYKIVHILKTTSLKETSLVEVFMIDKEQIRKKYQSSVDIVECIDYLAIPSLSFQALYQNKTLTQKNDLFIYIAEDEAFVTFYKEGIYLSSKKIESLNSMATYLYDRGIKIEVDELKTILLTKGLDKSKYTPQEYNIYDHIVNIFTKLFIKIDNLAIHNRSIFNYTQTHRVFFGINNKQIPNIKLVAQSFTKDAEFYNLSFSVEKNSDVLNIVCALYARNSIQTKKDSTNLTIFERKQPFYKSELGKLSIISAVTFTFICIYLAYKQYMIVNLQDSLTLLQQQHQKKLKATKLLQSKSKKVKSQLSTLTKTKEEVDQKLYQVQSIIDTLINLKSYDKKYTSTLLTINKLLSKYSLNIDKITQIGKNRISIELYSTNKQRDMIASFMNELLNRGFVSVSSNKIQSNEFGYKSTIEIQR